MTTTDKPAEALRFTGSSRDAGHPRALIAYFNREPTDDELRAFHEHVRALAAHDAQAATPAVPARTVDIGFGPVMCPPAPPRPQAALATCDAARTTAPAADAVQAGEPVVLSMKREERESLSPAALAHLQACAERAAASAQAGTHCAVSLLTPTHLHSSASNPIDAAKVTMTAQAGEPKALTDEELADCGLLSELDATPPDATASQEDEPHPPDGTCGCKYCRNYFEGKPITKDFAPASPSVEGHPKFYAHVYEFDGPLGLHRSFSPNRYNGNAPSRTVAVYTLTALASRTPAPSVEGLARKYIAEDDASETNVGKLMRIGRELADAALASREPAQSKWEGAAEWEPLAWALCAEEHGEDACNELVWEGGPVPEPWGDRWMKYEGAAKRLIALVREHVPAFASRKPVALTVDDLWKDEGIMAANARAGLPMDALLELVRAVESAHRASIASRGAEVDYAGSTQQGEG